MQKIFRAGVVRLALWRMDSWLGPQLAREASRPYFEYAAFVPNNRAYTRLLNRIEAGEVLSPSPLLRFDSDLFPIHFQLDDQGVWSSPQVPSGNQLDLAQDSLMDQTLIAEKSRLLRLVREAITPGALVMEMGCVEVGLNGWIAPDPASALEQNAWNGKQQSAEERAGKQDLTQRVVTNLYNQNFQNNPNVRLADNSIGEIAKVEPQYNRVLRSQDRDVVVSVGPLLPVWLDQGADPGPLEISFVRRVEVGDRLLLQGLAANWNLMRKALHEQVQDLFPGARVELQRALMTDTEDAAHLMATIPVRLAVEFPPVAPAGAWSPARVTLGITWLAALLGLAGLALSLHASITYADKRSRFASSVTHELRTPLTTFRMYTEMLVEGMVGEDKRREYLRTLQREADRLSVLVENVLAFARLEEGRAQLARERLRVDELLERCQAVLAVRVRDCGGSFTVDSTVPANLCLETDAGAVEQVLFNLVDNACKYGAGEQPLVVRVEARAQAGKLEVMVCDNGPGVPAGLASAIFRAFDRGEVAAADPRPGIGLGLALCRGLARDLGGELELRTSSRPGACFVLRLPLAGDAAQAPDEIG